MIKKPGFLHVDTDSLKPKVDWKMLGGHGQKMGVATLVSGLQNWLSQEWVNGII